MKKILFVLSAVVFSSLFTFCGAQSLRPAELQEKILATWPAAMEQMRVDAGANKDEYATFTRFYRHSIDSVYIEFTNKINNKSIGLTNVEEYLQGKKAYFNSLFENFRKAEHDYPTTVNEFRSEHRPRIGGDSCYASCNNTGFENGTFSGWYGYYAVNSSTALAFNIVDITGGYLGPVVKGAGPDPYTGNDYQLRITSGAATDWFLKTYSTYSMPEVSPWGGNHSVMMGDSNVNGYGVSILSQSFQVTSTAPNLTLEYSLLLENPAGHTFYEQPFFSAVVLDQNGDTIPTCGEFMLSADSGYAKGFKGIFYPVELDSVYWKPWTLINVPLTKYIGQCVTVIFQVQDCSLGGHFGYAYVDASCSPLQIIASSTSFCGQDSILLTAPQDGSHFAWSGPTNSILSADTLQSVWVDSAGTYTVISTPSSGSSCADTLTITIGKTPGPPPHPSFHADTACAGSPVMFFNTSNPATGLFSWDFYDIGVYNISDTSNYNPTWTYPIPGTYHAKLHEVYNGCGYDTVVTIVVDSLPVAAFTATGTCVNTPVTFTNSSKGGTKYSWNFGDPASGPLNTSALFSPSHTYTSAATYTVTLAVSNAGHCADTVRNVITISPEPKPIITGKDSICPGERDTLTVTGGTSWLWSTGGTTSSISGVLTTTTTYTVTAYNGTCSHDTTFTVHVVPAPTAIIRASKDSVCMGDTVTLEGSGGLSYRWSTGNTTSKIIVTISSNSTFKLFTYSGSCADSASITIGVLKNISASVSASTDSLCHGDTAIITATPSGGSAISYRWSNGATTSTIDVSPTTTTTYTATVFGKCDSVVLTITIVVCPTGIDEIYDANQFNIFPNPGNGMFTIQSSGVNGKWSVGVYNELGQEVFTKIGNGKINEQINLENLASGIYSLKLQTNSSMIVKKLVIVRK